MFQFPIIRDTRRINAEQFISGIASPIKRMMVEDAFRYANDAINQFLIDNISSASPPTITVSQHAEEPQGGQGLIIIPENTINRCLLLQHPLITQLLQGNLAHITIPHSMFFFVAVAWTILHEYAHSYRNHAALLDFVGDDALSRKATEMDADMCAVASIYRVIQTHLPAEADDAVVRQIVIACLYWYIRSYFPANAGAEHPAPGTRIGYLVSKMGSLRWNPAEGVDIDNVSPESEAALEIMWKCVTRCDAAYLKAHPGARSIYENLAAMEAETAKVATKWDEMRIAAGILSATRA